SGDLPSGSPGAPGGSPDRRQHQALGVDRGVLGSRRGLLFGADPRPVAHDTAWMSAARVATAILDFYKRAISPWLPPACRFEPTCSIYAREAIARHGFWTGMTLASGR